jgi:hypothetical protein
LVPEQQAAAAARAQVLRAALRVGPQVPERQVVLQVLVQQVARRPAVAAARVQPELLQPALLAAVSVAAAARLRLSPDTTPRRSAS